MSIILLPLAPLSPSVAIECCLSPDGQRERRRGERTSGFRQRVLAELFMRRRERERWRLGMGIETRVVKIPPPDALAKMFIGN